MPTEQEWEAHKDAIHGLYMVQNVKLQGPGGLMEQMNELGFYGT